MKSENMCDMMEQVARGARIRFIKHDPNRRCEIAAEIQELNRQGYTVLLYVPGPDVAGSDEEDKV